MKKFTTVFVTLLLGIALSLGSVSDAYAKRFGGGRSFGSKPSYSQSYSYNRAPSQSAGAANSTSRQQAYTQNQAARDALNKRGGLMGMLGGLALGGLLGALFFGGAFQGVNFLDMLMFAGVAYLLFKLFAARSRRPEPLQTYTQNRQAYRDDYSSAYDKTAEPVVKRGSSANFDTDLLFGKGPNAGFKTSQETSDAGFEAAAMPAGFDSAAFLDGAKNAYRSLQTAWDKRDLAEIRGLTTDKVFAEIQDQLRATVAENRTEVLKLEAELLDCREIGNELEAVVLFDAILREERDAQADQVREVWHFIKSKNSLKPTWFLDGIQQLED